jgi:hypothetical protein
MSYATFRYAEILSTNIRTLRRKTAVEVLLSISEPLVVSVETIKEKAKSTSLYELMIFTGAIRLYEQGKKEFYFPDVRSTVRNEITKNRLDAFDSFSKLYSGFDNLIKAGAFVRDPTGRKRYMLSEEIQRKLDEITQC